MNEIKLSAYIEKDATYHEFSSGQVSNLFLRHENDFKKRDGTMGKEVLYIKAVCWGNIATQVKDLKKGDVVEVEGKLKTDSWEKDGVKQYDKVITVSHIDITSTNTNQHSGAELDAEHGYGDVPF